MRISTSSRERVALLRPEVPRRSAVISGCAQLLGASTPSWCWRTSCSLGRFQGRLRLPDPVRVSVRGSRAMVCGSSAASQVPAVVSSPSARARLQRGARVWDAGAPDPVRGLDPQPRPFRPARLRLRGGASRGTAWLREQRSRPRRPPVPRRRRHHQRRLRAGHRPLYKRSARTPNLDTRRPTFGGRETSGLYDLRISRS